jgi:hypothetical protein
MFQESRVWMVHRAENFAAICEPIVWTTWDPVYLFLVKNTTHSPVIQRYMNTFIRTSLQEYSRRYYNFSSTDTISD